MDQEVSPQVADVVARFLESRRQGRRTSIDEVLSTFDDVSEPERTRVEALREIARRARTVPLPAGSSDDVGDLSVSPVTPSEFPAIEGYDIIAVLGCGGMGVVYEAYQRSTGRRVAIKFMLAATARSEAGRRRFEREVELIARLQQSTSTAGRWTRR
jgi:serine/threonine protein kinase